jgi:hypothetical protein
MLERWARYRARFDAPEGVPLELLEAVFFAGAAEAVSRLSELKGPGPLRNAAVALAVETQAEVVRLAALPGPDVAGRFSDDFDEL